jgi:hypothetical protein
MNRCVSVVSNSQQQHLSIELIDATGRAVQAMRYVHRMSRRDFGGSRTDCRESMRAVAAEDARQLPEGIGDHAHPEASCLSRIEGMIVVVAHARHGQRAPRPHCCLERRYQAARSTLDRGYLRERRMYEQNASALHSQREELFGQLTVRNGLTHHY